MLQRWPVKRPIRCYEERLLPTEPLVTKMRIIDTFFPVGQGGTYCIPGPFGAGKTVLQQITSRYAEVDVVIIAACGERAGEVVETLREFPELIDPRTGRTLMERTIIICNTSLHAGGGARGVGLHGRDAGRVLPPDGPATCCCWPTRPRAGRRRCARCRGRLEEIPGEEAFPAYLESRIAGFYERAGSGAPRRRAHRAR